jgi:hypothetical protein
VVNHVRAGDVEAQPSAANTVAGDQQASAASSSKQPDEDEAHAEEVRALAKRDAEVRAHEQAHAAAGGAFAGAPSYSYQRGPDGRSYAVSGEVPIDVSAISGDPEATIQKMRQVKRAALAPRDPSDADRAIAATADAMITAARSEQMTEKSDEASPMDVDETSASAAARGEQMTEKSDEASPMYAQETSAGTAAREVFSAYERRSRATAYALSSR